MKKTYLILAILWIYISSITYATFASFHERVVFIGSNEKYYYFLSIQCDLKASSNDFFQSVTYICKFQFDGKQVSRKLLSATNYTDENSDGDLMIKDKVSGETNLFTYLKQESVRFDFPVDDLKRYTFTFNEQSIISTDAENRSFILADQAYLKNYIRSMFMTDLSDGKIIELFSDRQNFYLVIQIGSWSTDLNGQQAIVVIPQSSFYEKTDGNSSK